MKKAAALALGLAVLATATFAQTNQVLSRNAVGYQRVSVPASNRIELVRLDFSPLQSSITVSNMLGNQLPDGARIYLWNKSIQGYNILTKNRGAWPQGTTIVGRSQAFFLSGPTNFGNTNYPVYLLGEVPDKFTAPTTTVSGLGPGLDFTGYGYPVTMPWSNVALLGVMSNGSRIALWNTQIQGYDIYTKNRGTWPSGLLTNFLRAGQGFWTQTTQSMPWVESKPYTWP